MTSKSVSAQPRDSSSPTSATATMSATRSCLPPRSLEPTALSATPKNYAPKADIVAQAHAIANETGGSVNLVSDPVVAVTGADAVYTDVCTSMGFEHEVTKRAPIFKPYQVNEAVDGTRHANAVFMHCLPAHRNAEVTDAVLDGPQSVVFDQAENRMHAQKALLLLLLGGT